jgi:hypothetical protein
MNGYHQYKSCIDACLRCAAVCNHCASSCLQDKDVQMMARCIQLDMECAAMCYATAQLLSMGSSQAKAICMICAQMCDDCANECSRHESVHCRECADVCRNCANQCRDMEHSGIHVNA